MFDFDEVGAKCLLLIFKPNRKGFFVLTNIKHLKLPEENYLIYNYKGEKYFIETFNLEWVKRRKDEILEVCKSNSDN